jgi:F-type H+-transporting ATPase subunit gamma
MPALIDIRRRIRSTKNTQQITKAMKMVSAAKLRRAQEAIFAARPYARKMMEVLNGVATRADPAGHPLLQERGEDRVLLVVVTADKGLAGGFNANIIRAAVQFLEERTAKELRLDLIGRKGRDFFKRRRFAIRTEKLGLFQALKFAAAREMADELIKIYGEGEVDQVYPGSPSIRRSRPWTTSTSRPRSRSSPSSSPGTCSSRSGGPCWSPRPRSTGRA